MNHRTLHSKNRLPRLGSRFTSGQATVLAIIGVLNVLLIGLGIFAWSLMNTPDTAAQGLVPTAALPLPPTWTPAPSPTAQIPALSQPLPLPPECDSLPHDTQQGTVTRVVNPSTLEVNVNGAVITVSFAGIQPPEIDSATTAIQGMVEGQPVTLVKDVSDQDAAGRLVRYVFAGGRFLNVELVRLGLARPLSDSPDRACAAMFQQAEQQARLSGAGIWKPTPIPTATFIPFVTLDPNRNGGCDCSIRYECSDFSTHESAQTCYNLCNDYSSRLDEDRDGLACENLP